ncbi:MAG: colicin D domain-containing protein [Myxococcota bacterium]
MSKSTQSLAPRFASMRHADLHARARDPISRGSRRDEEVTDGLPSRQRDLWEPNHVARTPMLADATTTRAPLARPEPQGVHIGGPQARAIHASNSRAISNASAPQSVSQTERSPDSEGLDVGFAVNPQIAYIRAYNYAIRAGLSREEAAALAAEVREIHRQQHASLFDLTLSLAALVPFVDMGIDLGELVNSISRGELFGSSLAAAGLLLPFVGVKTLRTIFGMDGLEAGGNSAMERAQDLARVGVRGRVVSHTSKQLQKKFKHAEDFGVSGSYTKDNATKFLEAIQEHVSSGRTQEILGQYRGKPAIHFLDPETGLNVVTDTAGNFVTGWKLSVQQLEDVLTRGWLW